MSERLALFRHLAAKDWRPLRPWAVVCWIASAAAWLPAWGPSDAGSGPLAGVLAALAALLPALAVARLLHLDPVPGTQQLWLTRPIPPGTLLLAKLTLVTLTVLLPCFLLAVVPLVFTGVPLRWSDHVLVWIGTTVVYLAFYAGVALPAALTRNMAQLGLLLATGSLAYVVLRYYSWQWRRSSIEWLWEPGVEVSRELVLRLLAAAAGLAGAVVLYRRRRVRAVGALAVALAVPLFALTQVWPLDVTGWAVSLGAPSAPSAPANSATPDWRRVQVVVDGSQVGTSQSTRDGVAGPARLSVAARVAGLPPDLLLEQVGYSATARVEWPDRVHLEHDDPRQVSGWLGRGTAETIALGCPSSSDRQEVEIAHIEGASVGDWPALHEVRGTLRFTVGRPFVLARGPARPGARLALPRRLLTVTSLTMADGRQGLVLDERHVVAPVLDGLWPVDPDPILFDPIQRRCYHPSARSHGTWRRQARYERTRIELQSWTPSFGFQRPREDFGMSFFSMPRERLDRSELVFLSVEELGTLEVPFFIPEVVGGSR
jgi:hypothetical protein